MRTPATDRATRPARLPTALLVVLGLLQLDCKGKPVASAPPPPAKGTFHAGTRAWEREASRAMTSWKEAAEHCQKLELAGGRWRLPTRDELVDLASLAAAKPELHAQLGPGSRVWSATPVAGNPAAVWTVNPVTGTTLQSFPTDPLRTRCTREIPGAPSTRDPSAESADPQPTSELFTAAKRQWRLEPPDEEMTWEEARRHCEALTAAGGGWRLPTLTELESLLRVRDRNETVARLPGLYAVHWSGTVMWCEREGDGGTDECDKLDPPGDCEPCFASAMNFHSGAAYPAGLGARYRVRCVRPIAP